MTDSAKQAVEDLFEGPDISYKRYLVLGLAMLTGLAVASLIAYVTIPGAEEAAKSLPRRERPGVADGALKEAMSSFFFFMWLSGVLYARLFRARKLGREILRNSEWHLAALHALSLLGLASTWLRMRRTESKELEDVGLLALMAGQAIVTLALLIGTIRFKRRRS